MVDTVSRERRSLIMSKIKDKDTAPELTVRKLVHGMGYRFRLHCKDLPGKPDLVFPRLGCVIFVHGCFWHPHANCSDSRTPESNRTYWIPKLQANSKRDARNQASLRRSGWRVMVVRDCQTKDAELLRRRVERFLR